MDAVGLVADFQIDHPIDVHKRFSIYHSECDHDARFIKHVRDAIIGIIDFIIIQDKTHTK